MRTTSVLSLQRTKKNYTYVIDMNIFADQLFDEVKERHLNTQVRLEALENVPRHVFGGRSDDLSEKVNWIERGVVTPVKDEGSCGASWAFASVGALESAWAIKSHKLLNLSEVQLLACAGTLDGNWSCPGGSISTGLEYIVQHGLSTVASLLTTGDGVPACDPLVDSQNTVPARAILDYRWVRSTALDLKSAIMQQPVSVMMEVNTMNFVFYKYGVFNMPTCGSDVNHAVLAVGYDVGSWLLKNSWGFEWGCQGYLNLEMKSDEYGGMCGVQMYAFYPEMLSGVDIFRHNPLEDSFGCARD